ncbi:MAG: YncE family protein [Acidobacteriia bacterium]|nr:YncE family protein [Terriglobia bacterium]
MKHRIALAGILLGLFAAGAAAAGYHVVKKVAIGGPDKWDYVLVDETARRVYVTHLDQVNVLDADTGAEVGKIADLHGAHGVALAPKAGRGFITNGLANAVTMFDLKTLAKLGEIPVGDKPDAIVYDPASDRVFAINGEANSATAIDPATGKAVGAFPLGEGPEFAVSDGAGHLFVNLEDESKTLRVDSKAMKVTDRWPLAPCAKPTSIAMDAAHARVFVGCRSKAMAVVNAETGKVVTTLPIGERVDATFFDAATSLVYFSTGDGAVSIFHEDTPDKYTLAETVKTLPGGRTMALDTKTRRIYVPAMDEGKFTVLILEP